MTLNQKKIASVLGLFLAILLILGSVLMFSVSFVKANPSFFIRSGNGATSTPLGFLSPGAATTTIPVFDLGVGGAQGADSAILALQFTGSTTPTTAAVATTTYNVALEYSQDNIDWYSSTGGGFATTTTLGTQTLNGTLIASTTPTKIFLVVITPTRYIRGLISIPNGSTRGSVWGEFIAKRQSN